MHMNLLIACLMIKWVECEWVDPYEMNTNAKSKYLKPSIERSVSVPSDISSSKDIQVYQSHLKRLIGLITNAAHLPNKDEEIYEGYIRFTIEPDDWEFLISFSKNDITLENLRKLNTILSESFKRSVFDDYMDVFELYQMKIYSLIFNVGNLWIIGSLFMIHVIYQLLRNGFSFGYIVKYLVFVVFVWDFAIRYQTLMEQVEEHNLHVIYSKQCDTTKMSIRERLTHFFSSTDCGKKSVTPLDVFLVQIKQLIIIPLRALGTGMGGFGHEMFTKLPWGLNLVLWPIMLLFVVILASFMMISITGYNIDFNILHLFKIRLELPSKTENHSKRRAINRLAPDLVERPMIQEISTSDEKQVHRQITDDVGDNKRSKRTNSENNRTCPTKKQPDEALNTIKGDNIKDEDNNIETINDGINSEND